MSQFSDVNFENEEHFYSLPSPPTDHCLHQIIHLRQIFDTTIRNISSPTYKNIIHNVEE